MVSSSSTVAFRATILAWLNGLNGLNALRELQCWPLWGLDDDLLGQVQVVVRVAFSFHGRQIGFGADHGFGS
jgi:hypothetical protein